MQIREITPDDRVGIAGVLQRAFAAAPWNEVWSDDSALALIDEWLPLPRFFGLVAVSDGTIVGVVFGRFEAWDRKRLFYMKELCVAPEYQRSGVGAELNQALEQRLKSEGVGLVYLHTLRDSPAAAFYAAQDYRCSEQMVMFSKKLG